MLKLLIFLCLIFIIICFMLYYKDKNQSDHKSQNGNTRYRGHNCDIMMTPNGKYYYPIVNGRYIFITVGGQSVYFGHLSYYSMFDTKEKAMSFLNEWLDRRGVDSVSVWTNNKKSNEQN